MNIAVLHAIDQYQTFTQETAIYPGGQDEPTPLALAYVGLGLCDELAELSVALSQSVSMHKSYGSLVSAMAKEIGDVYWYVARIAHHKTVSLGTLYAASLHVEPAYEASRTGAIEYAIQVGGAIAGKIKKELRDGTDCRQYVIENLPKLIRALCAIGDSIDHPVLRIMRDNEEKLRDRKDRNVLQGSGDNR
jgi:NTP pyrophosphatase (non-canonical NTP hydrolase)